MIDVATCSRTFQFESGPQTHTFHACEKHRSSLLTDPPMCFLELRKEPVVEVDPEDEIECYYCRGEHGP